MDLIENPLQTIDAWFFESVSAGQRLQDVESWEERTRIIELLKGDIEKIPSLNTIPLVEHIPLRGLIRYRGMIQEVQEQEIYPISLKEGSNVTPMKYRDYVNSEVNFSIEAQAKFGSRDIFYCVPLPGETSWARNAPTKVTGSRYTPMESITSSKRKRSYSQEEEKDEIMERIPLSEINENGSGNVAADDNVPPSKKRIQESKNESKVTGHHFNCPLPWEEKLNETRCALLKVYDNQINPAPLIHDIVEVIGIFHLDNTEPGSCDGNSDEEIWKPKIPYTQAPRVHVLDIRKCPRYFPCNPLEGNLCNAQQRTELARKIREYLTIYATNGDEIMAYYLLFSLIQQKYKKPSGENIGILCIGYQIEEETTQQNFIKTIQSLMPRVAHLKMSLETLNTMRWVPEKSSETEVLEAGMLQLPAATCAILDETNLTAGQLDATGVQNLTKVGNYIREHGYMADVPYTTGIYMPTDHNTLMLTSGKKTLVSPDFMIPARETVPMDVEEKVSVSEEELQVYRSYIYDCITRGDRSFTFTEDARQEMTKHFVKRRKEDPQLNENIVSWWADMARFEAILFNRDEISTDLWQTLYKFELERQKRIGIQIEADIDPKKENQDVPRPPITKMNVGNMD